MKNITLHPFFSPLDLDNPDHNKAMVLFCIELEANGELVDLRENIQAPLDQLSENGQLMVTVFRSIGVKTPGDVDLLEDLWHLNPTIINHLKYIP